MYGWEAITRADGLNLMIVGMLVVFIALLVLITLMKVLRVVLDTSHEKRLKKDEAHVNEDVDPTAIPGVEIAAIALTLILEEESMHDQESMVLTLQSLPKPYNNWWMDRLSSNYSPPVSPTRGEVLRIQNPVQGSKI